MIGRNKIGSVRISHPESEMTVEDVLDIISNERRRFVIRHLEDDNPTTVRQLAGDLSELIGDNDYKASYVSLYQTHLDQMARKEVIEYDSNRKIVSQGRHFDATLELLNEIEQWFDADSEL